MHNNYKTFFAMIGTSSLLMYGAMYLHTYAWDHVLFSETRLYMNLLMTAIMAVVMLYFMRKMYTNQTLNRYIIGGSVGVFFLALVLVRSQVLVDDVSYMKAMIPHHSIAILTSERARISDPRVKELAENIIEAQRKEIEQMKELIQDLR